MKIKGNRLLLMGSVLGVVLVLPGCAFVDGVGLIPNDVTKPDHASKLASAKAEGDKVVAARERSVGPISPSVSLVEAELRHHLRRVATDNRSPGSLTVHKRGGMFFGAGVYEIAATADLTAEQTKEFLEAAKRLQGHLESNPIFIVRIFHTGTEGPVLFHEAKIR